MKTQLALGVLAVSALVVPAAWSQPGKIYSYNISSVVGNYALGDGGAPTKALLAYPYRVTIDSKGVVYIADTSNHVIRKIVGGQISTIAGNGTAGFSGDGKSATAAQLYNPSDVAVDASGNVYIYDLSNSVIRKVDSNGIITTFAGTPQTPGAGGDGGPAAQAKLYLGLGGGIAVDSAGNVYISDFYNSVIRKVATGTNVITTVAGVTDKPGSGGDGGPATSALLYYPAGIALDSSNNLYIADLYNQEIRMVSAKTGNMSIVAGTGKVGSTGDGGAPTAATLNYPEGVALDTAGNVYIATYYDNKIRKVTVGANPVINTLAGTGTLGFSGDGGPAISAVLGEPFGVAVDAGGTVYIADTVNCRIRIVSRGNISEFAGADHAAGDAGPASAALLFFPQNMAWDNAGNLYIADTNNNRVRKVTTDGNISTYAGNGTFTFTGDGGPAIMAGISKPTGVAVDSGGNLYVASGNQIRKIDTKGMISTIVNTANAGGFTGDGQLATGGELDGPLGLAVDGSDNLYIADEFNHRIRKVSAGIISTVAGSGPVCGNPCDQGKYAGDNGPATSANLAFPTSVAFDPNGRMLIADASNNVIRAVDPKGIITTLAGKGRTPGYGGDIGPATSALMGNPFGVTADSSGNVYFADTSNQVVRMVDALGIISTVAGTNVPGFSGDGGPGTAAQVSYPHGLTVDQGGNVWFADQDNHRIRKLTPTGPQVGNGPLGVVNAASFVSGGIVPGGMATLFGASLTTASGINLTSSIPLATDFMGTSVKFNNTIAAGLFAVDNVNGQQQINFQVPWELAGQQGVILQVNNNGALSAPVAVHVLDAQPGVFAYYVGSDLFGVILHTNYTLADTAHPVKGGDTVLIYCTNLGAVSPAIADGVPGTGQEQTVAQPMVTIGGLNAVVSFSGIAPGFVGLNQLNVEVPKGLDAKNQPVIVTMKNVASKPVLLPVTK